MFTTSDPGGSNTLDVSPSDLQSVAQTLRSITADANASYQTFYNQLLNSISLLPGPLQNWALDNIHTWNTHIQNQVFSGNNEIADALETTAHGFSQTENSTKSMFAPH